MTAEKFVARLLDADDRLLAWATVMAAPQPIGGGRSCPFHAPGPTSFVIEAAGTVTKLVVHWCDLDVARVTEVPATPVALGQVFTFTWFQPVWLVAGMQGVPLPAVTVRAPVGVAPPTGSFAAVGG